MASFRLASLAGVANLQPHQRQNYSGGSEKPETRPCQEKLATHSPNLCIEVNPLELKG